MKVLIALTVAVLALAQAEDLSKYTPKDLFVIPNKPAPFNPKIVNGKEAEPHSFPHACAIYVDGEYFCGASVISKDVMLTAAHCVERARNVEVVCGAHNLKNNEETQQRRNSSIFVIHEHWNGRTLENDIALMKLEISLELNDVVQPIALDDGECTSKDLDGTPGTVSGWGKYGRSGLSPVLREVTNDLLPNPECSKYYDIEDTHICLSGDNGRSSCNGDSGGALLVIRSGKVVQGGIVSFGSIFGCHHGFPGAYTRVACFYSWINKYLRT